MFTELIIKNLQCLPPEVTLLFTFALSLLSILTLMRLFGSTGLYLYMSIAVIVSNILVLKAVSFSFFKHPIALGTVLFSSTFFVTDILSEYYGKTKATKAIWLSFISTILVSSFMILGIGATPLDNSISSNARFFFSNQAMECLFLPAPAILAASLIAYITSQFNDVWLFYIIKKISHNKMLWLRSNVSTIISSLIDNIVFNVLAWYVFATNPLNLSTLIFTYILGTYFFRITLSIAHTPFVYIAKYFVKND